NIARNFADKPDKPSFRLGTFGGFPGAHLGLPPLQFTAMGCFLVSVTFYAPISSLNLLLNRYIQLLIDVFTSVLIILMPILQARNQRPS
ncbi:hypothetical protein IW261DRAFT_1485071, partial [Armillaria novae-zelandiae]